MNEESLLKQLHKDREALHQIPELGFDLPKTKAYLETRLKAMGYQPFTIAKSGVAVHIQGQQKEAIAFRADMDALSVTEKTQRPFSSTHPGQMHACGHDGHMSIMLSFAAYLTEVPTPHHSLLLIFQPAEEGPGGAKVVVEEGVLSTYNVLSIFGFHLYPNLEEGLIGMVNGPMMAQNGEFDVIIKGQSAHGAQPHDGRDAITAGVSLFSAYQDLVTKMIDPFVPSVIAIGTFNAGEARNIIAQEASFTGTIRTFEEQTYDSIKAAMRRLATHTAEGYDVDINLEIRDFYPPVINDSALYQLISDTLDDDQQRIIKPMMFAEDFAFYQQAVPGVFMMLGTRNASKGYTHSLHSCYFDYTTAVLLEGVKTYAKIFTALEEKIKRK